MHTSAVEKFEIQNTRFKEQSVKVLSKRHKLAGSIKVPGSKSHTIRACIFAALAEGTSFIRNPLEGADCLSALHTVEAFGAGVETGPGLWKVTAPEGGLKVPRQAIDVGNSGSVLYFITPLAATFPEKIVITGDESIQTRPIDQLIDVIRKLGGNGFYLREGSKCPPVAVCGPISPGRVEHEGVLSQQISGLLMTAPTLSGVTTIDLRTPKETPFVRMTIDWMESVGIKVSYDKEKMNHFEVTGPQAYKAFDRIIPSDWEAAAFPITAAVITGSKICIPAVDTSGSQGDAAIVDVLSEMGADIEIDKEEGNLYVNRRGTGILPLKGGEFNCSAFPDAVPALSVAACFAEGDVALTDIGVVRLKETDRINILRKELSKLGASVEEGRDYILIHGEGGRNLHGGQCESYHDHRIAMSLAVMGLGMEEGVVVNNAECCSVSFPAFYEKMNGIGAGFVCNA